MDDAPRELVYDRVQVRAGRRHRKYISAGYTVRLEPPADLGLRVSPAGLVATLGRVLRGEHDVQVGDAAFDGAFEVRAFEPDRARSLLGPGLRQALLGWKDAKLRITDEVVVFTVRPSAYVTYSVDELAQRAPPVAALATAVEAALASVPPSKILAPHLERWQQCAEAHGLTFGPSPLRVWGSLDGARLTARAVAVAGGYVLNLSLRFAQPIRDPRALDLVLAVRLDEGRVSSDHDGLSVRTGAMTNPSTLGRIVARLATLTRELRELTGAYR